MATGRGLEAGAVAALIHDKGLLLQTDPVAVSAVGLLGGGPVAGSWWARPDGKLIFAGLQLLEHDPDIALFKLLNRKVTFVHRRLWPDVAAAGLSDEPWRTAGLSRDEADILTRVEQAGELSTREVPGKTKAVAALEGRLALYSRQVHRADGGHAKVLTSWPRWLALTGETARPSAAEARRRIEAAIDGLYAGAGKAVAPPWR